MCDLRVFFDEWSMRKYSNKKKDMKQISLHVTSNEMYGQQQSNKIQHVTTMHMDIKWWNSNLLGYDTKISNKLTQKEENTPEYRLKG